MHRVLPTLQFVREEVHLSRELSLFLQFMREQKKKIILEKNDKGSVAWFSNSELSNPQSQKVLARFLSNKQKSSNKCDHFG